MWWELDSGEREVLLLHLDRLGHGAAQSHQHGCTLVSLGREAAEPFWSVGNGTEVKVLFPAFLVPEGLCVCFLKQGRVCQDL